MPVSNKASEYQTIRVYCSDLSVGQVFSIQILLQLWKSTAVKQNGEFQLVILPLCCELTLTHDVIFNCMPK